MNSEGNAKQELGPREKEFAVWEEVDKALPFRDQEEFSETKSKPQLMRGWKSVRIFISSTFKDFHNEREVLVKRVFPELSLWCQKQKIHLVECDLRWGVTTDDSNRSLKICLEEIDRCKEANKPFSPFFINLTSERIGYIPGAATYDDGDVLTEVLQNYSSLVKGLSVTEMEIVHAAYSLNNPNAIFMIRNEKFLDLIPGDHVLRASEEFKELQGESDDQRTIKREILKGKLSSDPYFKNKAETHEYSPTRYDDTLSFEGNVKFIKFYLDKSSFDDKVLTFFKRRILECYPPYPPCEHRKLPPDLKGVEFAPCVDCQPRSPYSEYDGMHNAYMEWKAESVIGRDEILTQIKAYVSSSRNKGNPLLVFGKPGVGKSALMAKVVNDLLDTHGYERVFFHFVGAVSKSTETSLLQRRIVEHLLKLPDSEIKVEPAELSQQVYGALTKTYEDNYVIVVDAFNQLDEDDVASLLNWIPKSMSVKCIFSMVRHCKQSKAFQTHFPDKQYWKKVGTLTEEKSKDIVRNFLWKYGKKLHEKNELSRLFKSPNPPNTPNASDPGNPAKNVKDPKTDCCNPLWLLTACEELRTFGVFKALGEKIESLPKRLGKLLKYVLKRLERETESAHLLKATLCLIEVSKCGLLESELRDILGYQEECFKRLSADAVKDWKDFHAVDSKLTSYRWAEIYRAVQVFIRPYGDSGEGQLDFHHRSFSKAVRKRYSLNTSDAKPCSDESVKFWHQILASYFCQESNVASDSTALHTSMERKAKFYPYHALAIGDYEGMEKFLCRWPVIEVLFSKVYSGDLIKYWQQIHSHSGDESRICIRYSGLLKDITDPNMEAFEKNTTIAKILSQATKYKDAEIPAKAALEIAEKGSKDYTEAKILLGEILKDSTRFNTSLEVSQIPDMRRAYTLQKEAVHELNVLKTQSGTANVEKFDVQQLNALASYCAFLAVYVEAPVNSDQEPVADRVTVKEAKSLKKEGLAVLKDAKRLVKKLIPKDSLLGLECLSTEGRLRRGNLEKCKKIWTNVIANSVHILGNNNELKSKALFNLGSNYEDRAVDLHDTKYSEAEGHYVTAYQYFTDYYKLLLEVYGPEHGLCKTQKDYLQKPIFKYLLKNGKIQEKLDDSVPQ